MKGRDPLQRARYKVGEMARLAGVSVRTIHHYEAIGLLDPSGRTDAGHRLYTESNVGRLARIKGLTALGFSLHEVRACFDDEAWSPLSVIEPRHRITRREMPA
jgi:DNA-binding transcriptional MerR regulator